MVPPRGRGTSTELRDGPLMDVHDEVEDDRVVRGVVATDQDLGGAVPVLAVGGERLRALDPRDVAAGQLAGEEAIWLGRDDRLELGLVVRVERGDQRLDGG